MPLRILIAHNRYQYRGGEDSVVDDELKLLIDHGHAVRLYERDNSSIDLQSRLHTLRETLWSGTTTRDMENLIAEYRPDVIHAHNTFPLISPSLYWVANKHDIPVVQTLHNFRLLCVQAMLLRDNRICEDCLGKLPWRGVIHRCYRASLTQSAAAAGMLTLHRLLGSYSRRITRFIALNSFCRDVFVRGGLPAHKISIKPNFVDLPDPGVTAREGRPLFVGRLSSEKGLSTLAGLAAHTSDQVIDVVGTGPDEAFLSGLTRFHLHGNQPPEQVYRMMRSAPFLIMPSIWYENFPRTLVEAFACRLPVIASRLGALACLIEDGKTGLLFDPDSSTDLQAKITWALNHPREMAVMGDNARASYEATSAPVANLRILESIYAQARSEIQP